MEKVKVQLKFYLDSAVWTIRADPEIQNEDGIHAEFELRFGPDGSGGEGRMLIPKDDFLEFCHKVLTDNVEDDISMHVEINKWILDGR